MSGKPPSVGASRAGVPGGPARVLVYVADPRQLEPGAVVPDPPPAAPPPSHLDALYLPDNLHQLSVPRNTVYRTQVDCSEQRNQTSTVFYKPSNDVEGKLSVFSADHIPHRPDFLQIPQQLLSDQSTKVNEVKVNEHSGNLNIKSDCVNSVSGDLSAVESFQSRIALEGGDLATYQRCAGSLAPDSALPSMHQVALQHGHNQFSESVTVQSSSDGSNSGDRELSRSYVNYQVLEQSVSHQSIVNQSISILNQQVGVSRGIVSEGDSGHAPQLVRTADGVVLAVLPSTVLPQAVDSTDLNLRTVSADSPQTIVVPLGWRRIINGTSVLYVSPSGTALSTLPQLREYLQTAGTCKCGLPCPLRPETAFSFDPKVASKPYQASSGAELTKLCNHKRKLLATLQARAHSPATPPPQHHIEQKKVPAADVAVLKKKMKKRPNFPPNMTVSQLMVQRDRPLNDFKPQENEHSRNVSPGTGLQRPNNGQSCLPTFAPVQQNVLNANTQDNDVKQDTHVQRSSHYLTVNSGWITQQQQENVDGQKPGQPHAPSAITPLNVGLPVLGTNGQVIGVNTGFNKQTNYKNFTGVMTQNIHEQDNKDEKKDIPTRQSIQPVKNSVKEEESQIFCGLNQPLTPEVMQKINEQQQIFIQQNQKQIEMAMKGFKTQLAENVNQCKPQNQNQCVPQGQLVIQNGAVVKTNPAKTPPWQVKRNDSNNSNSMSSPNPKMQKIENSDYDESNTSISDDSLNSYSSYPNEHAMNQAMCSRVPPLPQHYNLLGQQWPNTMDMNKKKVKTNNGKGTKKKGSPTENKLVTFGSNGVRMMPDNKNDMPNNNVPSFMDDPSGYLAQQTVLLNNTISRQGINSSYDSHQYENPSCYGVQNQVEKCKSNKSFDVSNSYRSNLVPNPSPSPNNTPDSSVLSDKSMDSHVSHCCKGCNISVKGCGSDFSENQMRLKYMKQCSYKMETDGSLPASSPKHGFDDNPVTSSTFIERSPMINDNCGPIQAGTVSTSNVSPTETLQPPEPSPTLSNSSRSTDTPHSSGSSNTPMQSNCSYPISSPAYSNPGSCKDHFNSNPSTPGSGQIYAYNSPGPPFTHSISGTQMMHFISNHNVNKNLMEVDNISMVGVKPGLKPPQDSLRIEARRRIENSMPGYCPPPHLGGGPAHSLIQACYVQTFVTTMASGFSVTRDTVTSVLAGKANTATTSINASHANFIRPPPPPSVNLATTYAIPNNQPDPFINSVNLPTSYPLHIAGTTAQNMISKSPLEMVQNVIGSIPSKPETSDTQTTIMPQVTRRPGHTTPGQILISSTGQIIVSNNQMPPPPPKTTLAVQGSNAVTNVTTSVSQVVPAVGGVQPIVNQPTVVVNTLQAPFVIQPPMMAVDGQVVQQNAVLPQIVTGGIVSGQSPNESPRQIDMKNGQSYVQGMAMLSPESLKKRNKKKKTTNANITNVLQITAPQQNPNNLMVHHTSPQHNSSPQFSPRSFQLSPNNNISPTPMLQALTIVPGKSGTPAHIVMNGQGNANNFGSQQIITNTSPSQQINLLQPVNLINNASGVMPNFPAFQQFIVPNLGGMVMTADGTAIIQDNSTGMPVQLQLQTVNGQNVLTPVQGPGVFAGSNGGVVIRAPAQQAKTLQSQHSPGAQFLSPSGQVVVSGPGFGGQLSPLLANLSPTGVQFNAGQMRAADFAPSPGQVAVPLSPKRALAAGRTGSTFVQQNTTIVQQQTTLVSGAGRTRLGVDPAALLGGKPAARRAAEARAADAAATAEAEAKAEGGFARPAGEAAEAAEAGEAGWVRHSVSTQTAAAAGARTGSPPDTTTHSPLGALEAAASPRRRTRPDTTTESPEPADASSSAMVQCVSSSEQDMAEAREHAWATPRNDFSADNDAQNNMMSNVPLMRQNRVQNPVESTEMHYNQNMNSQAVNNQHNMMPMTSNYYDRNFTNKHIYKRKNDFGDGSAFRTDKIMRTNYNMVHGIPKDSDYDNMGISSPDKAQARQFPPTGAGSDASTIQKVFDRHNLGSGDDGGRERFARGDVVWGPVRGHGMWPGQLVARGGGAGAGAGRWALRWFGSPPAPAPLALPARRLLTLSEGLEAQHAARTKHRKSRKLNTLLENAIQEAMAVLDKKSEEATDKPSEDTEGDVNATETITETPKRSKKHDKVRSKDKHNKKNPAKLAPNLSKTGDNSRLRSSR